jgi:hypothetical protein
MKHTLYIFIAFLLFSCKEAPTIYTAQSLAPPVVHSVIVAPINPVISGSELTVDIAIKANTQSQRLFGMNVRFFVDNGKLKFKRFDGFAPGYGAVSPSPPIINIMKAGSGSQLFGFVGTPTYINGAVQLTDHTQPPWYLSDTSYTKVFSIVFEIKEPHECPMVIIDKELNPARGGFAGGSAGVVVTLVSDQPGMESMSCVSYGEHLNWVANGSLSPPFGYPISSVCLEIN